MSTSVYDRCSALANILHDQVGRYQGALGQANEIDQALALMGQELESAIRTTTAILPYVQEATRLSGEVEDEAKAQAQEQIDQAIRILDDAKEALLKVQAHHQKARQDANLLVGVLCGNAQSCSSMVASAYKTCEAMAKECAAALEKFKKNFGPRNDVTTLAKEFKKKVDAAHDAAKIADGFASKVGDTAEALKAAIDELEPPAAALVEAMINQLKQAGNDRSFLPSTDEVETLAATIKGFLEAVQSITDSKNNKCAKLSRRIANASKATQDAVNALKAL